MCCGRFSEILGPILGRTKKRARLAQFHGSGWKGCLAWNSLIWRGFRGSVFGTELGLREPEGVMNGVAGGVLKNWGSGGDANFRGPVRRGADHAPTSEYMSGRRFPTAPKGGHCQIRNQPFNDPSTG